ncbi:SusC/RagA family TonB-linked outer membrane protein [Sphingobacterium faecium]|uniref:SusC/RagA family TonB-linked outer membrane protein n=1 Tax=Sphingobacterium faecium TaxID=34087 RepID=UPI002468EBA1|nr:TonB-dependent receptor [Sphingobacterium faecium]MDH5827771.1 TonB-dependent receptor [Sphingobacterium faecium]
MKQTLLSFFVGSMILTSVAFAQEKKVSGRVTGADGKPLVGVTIAVQGSNLATQTDANGNYSFSVPTGKVIVYRSVGFSDKTLIVKEGQSSFNVTLDDSQNDLDEVVVTGYGTQRKREVTGAIASIKGDAFRDVAGPSIDKALQGQAAGVQASNTSGILGQAAKIRIRGTNSISSSSDPLFVVDGVPYITGDQGANTATNPLSDINPNDIANVEVLKDGAATAIYGSRASNGVILITTKSGKIGAPKLNYNNWFAVATPSKYYDLMNANQFIEITNEKLTNIGLAKNAFETIDPTSKEVIDHDWQKEVFRSAFQMNHALSMSGGTEKTNYFFSVGYADLDGISDANSQKKYSVRGKVEQKAFNDKLTIGVNTAFSHTTNRGFNNSESGLSGNVGGALYAFPNVPAKWADGSYNLSADAQSLGAGSNTRPIYGNYTNQRWVLDHNIYKNAALNFSGSGFANLEIIKGLNLRTSVGTQLINAEDYLYYAPGHGDGRGVNGRIYQYSLPNFRYNVQNTLNYETSFGDSRINVIVGTEHQKTRTRYFFAHGYGLSSTYFGENENIISGSLTNQLLGGTASERAFESYFGRANYVFKDRYFLSATLRRDKISSLPHGKQGATLPGLSLGWDIAKEEFFNSSIVSQFKVRGGYAKVGNTEIGNYPYAGTFAARQYGDYNGIGFSQAGNPDLKFETSKKINFGVDLAFLQDRIKFTADYFKNDIDNMILAVPTAPSLGVPQNFINQNVGKMFNKGFEFVISGTVIDKNGFNWTSNLNATFVKNEITQLVGNDITYTHHINRVGESIGSFFGYEFAGVNTANGNAIYAKADGSYVQNISGKSSYAVYDVNNKEDISKSATLGYADKRIMGVSTPTWYGGFNNTFNYSGFDLNIFLTFSGGNKVYNQTRQEMLNNQVMANAGTELLDRWTTPGQVTDVPKLAFNMDNSMNLNGNMNSRFLENGSFLRAQNIGIGYSFTNPVFLKSILATNLRVFAQVQNAFVITNYSGIDPEVGNSTTTNSRAGQDNRSNPIPRTFTVGLNVGF